MYVDKDIKRVFRATFSLKMFCEYGPKRGKTINHFTAKAKAEK